MAEFWRTMIIMCAFFYPLQEVFGFEIDLRDKEFYQGAADENDRFTRRDNTSTPDTLFIYPKMLTVETTKDVPILVTVKCRVPAMFRYRPGIQGTWRRNNIPIKSGIFTQYRDNLRTSGKNINFYLEVYDTMVGLKQTDSLSLHIEAQYRSSKQLNNGSRGLYRNATYLEMKFNVSNFYISMVQRFPSMYMSTIPTLYSDDIAGITDEINVLVNTPHSVIRLEPYAFYWGLNLTSSSPKFIQHIATRHWSSAQEIVLRAIVQENFVSARVHFSEELLDVRGRVFIGARVVYERNSPIHTLSANIELTSSIFGPIPLYPSSAIAIATPSPEFYRVRLRKGRMASIPCLVIGRPYVWYDVDIFKNEIGVPAGVRMKKVISQMYGTFLYELIIPRATAGMEGTYTCLAGVPPGAGNSVGSIASQTIIASFT